MLIIGGIIIAMGSIGLGNLFVLFGVIGFVNLFLLYPEQLPSKSFYQNLNLGMKNSAICLKGARPLLLGTIGLLVFSFF